MPFFPPLLSRWLRRADPATAALILPERRLRYDEALRVAPRTGLTVPDATAADIALALLAAGLGGGTVFPPPPGLAADQRARLLDLAGPASQPAQGTEGARRLALIIATSGSEGVAKGVRLPWRSVAAAARISGRALDLRPGDVWLACLPLHHVGGAMIPYRCWRAGATALVHEGFAAEAVLRDLRDHRASHVSLVPPMLARLLETGEPPPPTLRHALVGGAALGEPLYRRARAAGWPVSLTYGMTETCAMVAVDGRPLPGVRLRVAEAGVVEIATPARMAGYLGQADAGEWLATRDLGDLAGGRLRIAGRADDMLISAGVNVHPVEVEAGLSACPGIREAAVTGMADPVWGDIIAAVYEGEAGEATVESWCRSHLPRPHLPRRFLRVPQLPRTASGKLDRHGLLAMIRP